MIEIPKLDTKSKLREKGQILIQMKDIFGEEKSKEYYQFIEKNFQQGAEKIIQMWIEHASS